jgi:hypothetical protein
LLLKLIESQQKRGNEAHLQVFFGIAANSKPFQNAEYEIRN